MSRRTVLLLGLAVVGGTMMGSGLAQAASLSQWRWRSRLLIVFAPDESQTSLVEQRRRLAAYPSQSAERDLVTIEVVGDQAGEGLDAARLRSEYRVGEDQFAVVLIGKDGDEKLRRMQPISTQELFGTIDRMPMRRDEAARR